MRPQKDQFFFVQLEHKILRKSFNITLYLLIESFRCMCSDLFKLSCEREVMSRCFGFGKCGAAGQSGKIALGALFPIHPVRIDARSSLIIGDK